MIITWMSNIKEVRSKPRLHISVCQPIIWSMAAMLRDSTVAAVVRTRPRAAPLAMITMRKSTHGFLFVSHIWDAYGASSAINNYRCRLFLRLYFLRFAPVKFPALSIPNMFSRIFPSITCLRFYSATVSVSVTATLLVS